MRETNVLRVSGQLRIGDTEREQCVSLLREHYGFGRLTAPELDYRVELAFSAVTGADLVALMADLPQRATRSKVAARPALAVAHSSIMRPRSGSPRWRRLAAPAGALFATTWLMQTGDSSDWWHLTDSVTTGLFIASAGYACHLASSLLKRDS